MPINSTIYFIFAKSLLAGTNMEMLISISITPCEAFSYHPLPLELNTPPM